MIEQIINVISPYVMTAFIAPIVANFAYNRFLDIKAISSKDYDKIIKRYPKLAIVTHELTTEAKKVINPDDVDKLIQFVAAGLKQSIKGKFDDVVIDLIVKKIIESRKR